MPNVGRRRRTWIVVAAMAAAVLTAGTIAWAASPEEPSYDGPTADAVAKAKAVAALIRADNDGGSVASISAHAAGQGLVFDFMSAEERPQTIWLRAKGSAEVCVRIDGHPGRDMKAYNTVAPVEPCPPASPVQAALRLAAAADAVVWNTAGTEADEAVRRAADAEGLRLREVDRSGEDEVLVVFEMDVAAYRPDRPCVSFLLTLPEPGSGPARAADPAWLNGADTTGDCDW